MWPTHVVPERCDPVTSIGSGILTAPLRIAPPTGIDVLQARRGPIIDRPLEIARTAVRGRPTHDDEPCEGGLRTPVLVFVAQRA